jgi:hypothetical protein
MLLKVFILALPVKPVSWLAYSYLFPNSVPEKRDAWHFAIRDTAPAPPC